MKYGFFTACIAAMFGLAACGTTPQATPPAADAPSAQSAPATADSSRGIDMGEWQRYTHTSQLFSLDIPRGWGMGDSSTSEEMSVRFTDADENALVQTNLMTVTEVLDGGSLARLLERYLSEGYSTQQGFSQQRAEQQPNGSWRSTWGYDTPLPDGRTQRMVGTSSITQRGQLVGLVSVVVPDDQAARLAPAIEMIQASYTLDPGATDGVKAATHVLLPVEIANLQPYAHERFQIDAPSEWASADTSDANRTLITWTDPTGNGWLLVAMLNEDSQRTPEELASLLGDVISEAAGQQEGFALGEPAAQADDSTLITWTYTTTADNQLRAAMFGQGTITQRGERIAIVAATVPAEQSERLREPLEHMLASFNMQEVTPTP